MTALPFVFWSAFALFVGLHTYFSMLAHHHSLIRLLAYHQLVSLFWALATAPVASLARRRPLVPLSARSLLAHAGVASIASLAYIGWFTALELRLAPYDVRSITDFGGAYVEYFFSKFPIGVLIYAGTVGAVLAYDFHERSHEREVRAERLERELAEARLASLAAQLQPHFLFNALHTVSGLVRAGESRSAISTLAGLSDLLRYALADADDEVPLADELAAVRAYLAIQQLRFGDRLTAVTDVDPAALSVRIPRFLLQPLVENAIQHGNATPAGPWLQLTVRREDATLRIAIENRVDATAPAAAGGLGIGLHSATARLMHRHGDAARLSTQLVGDRFLVTVAMPCRDANQLEAAHA